MHTTIAARMLMGALTLATLIWPGTADAGLRLATKAHGDTNPPTPAGQEHPPYRRYTPGADMQRVEEALQRICPCLFIRVVHKTYPRSGLKVGDIVLRDPRANRNDLPRDLRKDGMSRDARLYCPPGQRSMDVADGGACVCDCYAANRGGCNLLLALLRAAQDTTIWDVPPGSGGNRHNDGDVRWNPGSMRGGEQDDGDTLRDPAVGLAHELAHAYHGATGTRGADRPTEELNTVRAENQIRGEMRGRMERERDQSSDRDFNKTEKARYDRLGQRVSYQLDDVRLDVVPPEGPPGTIATDTMIDCP